MTTITDLKIIVWYQGKLSLCFSHIPKKGLHWLVSPRFWVLDFGSAELFSVQSCEEDCESIQMNTGMNWQYTQLGKSTEKPTESRQESFAPNDYLWWIPMLVTYNGMVDEGIIKIH